MKSVAGLWIDHRKAVIVLITDKKIEKKTITSNVEKQPGRIDGVRSVTPYSSKYVHADDNLQKDFTGHLNIYYDKVISYIRNAEAILIFGPGEAKGELKKHLEKDSHAERIAAIETNDKMTDRQIEAKIKKYFKDHQKQ
jgi:hypothetical protein